MLDDMKNIVGNTTDNLTEASKPRQLTKEQWQIQIYKLKAVVIEIDLFYTARQILLVVEGLMEHPTNQWLLYLSIPGLLAGWYRVKYQLLHHIPFQLLTRHPWCQHLTQSNIFSLSDPEEAQQLFLLATFSRLDNLDPH
jgi:hypothetical protein